MGAASGLPDAAVVEALLAEPQQFDFCQAMELLEALDPAGKGFGQGLEKQVRLLPDEDLVFPASDIRACHKQGGVITVLLGFMGLYGIDAPMPHYLLDRATADDDDAGRLRDFLNIINPRFYALLYRAMQVERPAAGQLPAGFRGCAQALAGMLPVAEPNPSADAGQNAGPRHYFPVQRVRSASGLQACLRDAMAHIPVNVADKLPAWEPLGHGIELGCAGNGLGDDTILGGRIYTANGPVQVQLGPVSPEEAQNLLPGQPEGDGIQRMLDDYLGGQAQANIAIRVAPLNRQPVRLGIEEQCLGRSAWLGETLQKETVIRVAGKAMQANHTQGAM